MNNSQLFKAAHALCKKIRKEGDDYRATFGLCIRHIIKFGVSIMPIPPKKITYTFPSTARAPFGGKTFTGGVPREMSVGGKMELLVVFDEFVQGRQVSARTSDKPDLMALAEKYRSEEAEFEKAKILAKEKAKSDLEKAVPGLEILREAQRDSRNESDRYHSQFRKMMEDENNDGARPPKPINPALAESAEALALEYPRAALYLKAQRQAENVHWADNTGKGAAGRKAMEILASGGSLEDAAEALAERRKLVD